MDYDELLELAMELGYQLQMCGAETYRVEESINRLLNAYGVQGEVFAIPNSLIVSMDIPNERPRTRMRRIPYHGTDLDSVEQFNGLCRRLCAETPPPTEAIEQIKAVKKHVFPLPAKIGAYFCAAAGFTVFSGGNLLDGLCGGICGVVTGLLVLFFDNLKTNTFFKTIASGFVLAFLAYCLGGIGLADNVDAAIIGALMLLVPGLLFTNSVRDIIYGDINSGVNRLVEVMIIAVALAMGTAASLHLSRFLWNPAAAGPLHSWPLWIQCLACSIGSLGFAMLFNIHGPGTLLCVLGGIFCWSSYSLALYLGCTDTMGFFIAAMVSSLYAEIMARIRKYPATSYLIVSIFSLIPGGSIYFTMDHMVQGNLAAFSQTGLHTIALAGSLAVGILLVSTAFRMWGVWRYRKKGIPPQNAPG